MKSSVACLLVFSLVASATCARLRRQVPAAAEHEEGAPGGLSTPGKPMNLADGMDTMTGDLKNQESFGVPINPAAINNVAKSGFGSWKDAMSISNPSKSNIDQLMSPPKLAEDEVKAGGAPPA